MHSLLLRTKFVAQHYLIGKDFGNENHLHSHHYTLELEIEGKELDQYNYLLDIIDVRNHMDELVSYFKDKTLNELDEFGDNNPSLELFSQIIWQRFVDTVQLPKDSKVIVRIWEDDIAQAAYCQ